MSTPIPLQNDKHANLKVTESGDYSRYKDKHLIPIVAQDFFSLAAEFPLVFVKNSSADDFIPVAIMGLREGQNLYCQTEQWQAQVVPVGFTNSPFVIAPADEKGDQFAVLIEEDSPMLSEETGEALFKENGEKSEYLEKRVDNIIKIAQQSVQTKSIAKLLADKGLLATQQLQLKHRPDSPGYNIDGIYTVNEVAFNELSDEDFLDLRKRGIISMIYAHLTSLQQLRRISQLQYEADKAAGEY